MANLIWSLESSQELSVVAPYFLQHSFPWRHWQVTTCLANPSNMHSFKEHCRHRRNVWQPKDGKYNHQVEFRQKEDRRSQILEFWSSNWNRGGRSNCNSRPSWPFTAWHDVSFAKDQEIFPRIKQRSAECEGWCQREIPLGCCISRLFRSWCNFASNCHRMPKLDGTSCEVQMQNSERQILSWHPSLRPLHW